MGARRNRFARIITCMLNGSDGVEAFMEISILPGLPAVEIVGLCDSSVRESRERVRASIRQIGYEFPSARITVGLFPAYIHKSGSSFDLPIALGILIASGQINPLDSRPIVAFGELSLTGSVRNTPGAIAKLSSIENPDEFQIIIPSSNKREAELLGIHASCVCCLSNAVKVLCASERQSCGCGNNSISESVNFIKSDPCFKQLPDVNIKDLEVQANDAGDTCNHPDSALDFSCLKGQEKASRALVLAAAGMHNLLLTGSPGSGKTTAARVLRGILPPLSSAEKIEYLQMIGTAKILDDREIMSDSRPFRYVHHSCTVGKMIGDAGRSIPGELALSTHGILFLDEMAEFSPRVLDMLRQPLEMKCERGVMSEQFCLFPSRFLLVGAMNPCRCGRLIDSPSTCRCSVLQRRQYDRKISGPILDRMDLFCEMYRLRRKGLFDSVAQDYGTESEKIREVVKECWSVQFERCKSLGLNPVLNGEADGFRINELFKITRSVLEHAVLSAEKLGISARGLNKILRVARTIADLSNETDMSIQHVSEALQFRNKRAEEKQIIPVIRGMSNGKEGI